MHALRASSRSVVCAGQRSSSSVRRSVVSSPASVSRTSSVRTYALLSFLWPGGGKEGSMGNKHGKGWQPASADTPRKVSRSGFDVTPLTEEQRQEAAKALSELPRQVTLQGATERAFTGKTANGYSWDNKAKGVYVSAVGDLPLFSSETKFNSGTGWPSYYAPIDPDHIIEVTDNSIPYMPRVEVVDARSGAHLGHVFNDGPAPTGKRYCINAAALKFIPKGQPLPGKGAQEGQ